MVRTAYYIFLLMLLLIEVQPCDAARVNVYVNKFAVSSTENRDEIKVMLQALLMSRINNSEIKAVENSSDAELQVWGSYFVYGTVFSVDALIKTSSGALVDRVYVQGDNHNELIPSMDLLARHLHRAILKVNPSLAERLPDNPLPNSLEKVVSSSQKKDLQFKATTVNLPQTPAKNPASSDVSLLTRSDVRTISEKSWVSQLLPETMTSMAISRGRGEKGTGLFVTGERYLRYYLKNTNLQFITAVAFNPEEKIIAVDVADLDKDQVQEVYVTVLKGGTAASQVYLLENNQLRKIAENIPYLFRGLSLDGQDNKIYAQKINSNGNFSGDVYELNKKGADFVAENPLQLPPLGNLYNFNRFVHSTGKKLYVINHPDGYLLVYSSDRKLLWKSRDKFGGSEVHLCQSVSSESTASECSSYLHPRLQVGKNGDILIARNTGLNGKGASRQYTRNSLISFFWNGSSLQERWRTAQSSRYLADFFYDDQQKELLLLEVDPAADSQEDRGSSIVARQVQ